jgi:transcriptional regulator with XRE-family HTH domain
MSSNVRTVSRLQAIREERKLSRREVATQIGMSEKQLERWETGVTEVKRLHLIALADVYEVSVEDLEEPAVAA